MIRLASAVLALVILTAFDGVDAAQSGSDAAFAASGGEIRFNGAVVVAAGVRADADADSAASLPPGRIMHRGSADRVGHGPPRTVIVLPPREAHLRTVVITYD